MNPLETFVDDVTRFCSAIGINEDVSLVKLPSDYRQQNLYTEIRGIRWWFRQEGSEQDLEFSQRQTGEPRLSVQDIDFYFHPPTMDEIITIAHSERFLIKFDTLDEMTTYVTEHLEAIIALVSSSHFSDAVRQVRKVKKQVLEAD